MQSQVHQHSANAARMVTLNHPNAFDAICFQKVLLTENGKNEISGFTVLGNEDEPNIDYRELGNAKVLFVENWQPSKLIADKLNANDSRVKAMALIESDIENLFELNKGDIFYLLIDEHTALCYEIVGIELPIGIPTLANAKRYLLNKRDELDYALTTAS